MLQVKRNLLVHSTLQPSTKVPAKSRVMKFTRNLISNNYMVVPDVPQANNVCSLGLDDSCLHLPSPSTLKRACSYGSSRIEDYPRKKRASVIMGTAPLMEKVDAIAYPQNNMGEKYMHYSFTSSTNQLYGIGKKNPCNVKTTVEQGYSCSNVSSVGSCSVISGSANEFFDDTLAGPFQDDADSLRSNPEFPDVDGFYGDMLANPCQSDGNTICSDADSLDVEDVDVGCTFIPKEVVAEKIHRLELNAYHCTLEAMYASGPLSWEKEEVLTNLRISLNISNDEHLIGIKNLVSGVQNF